MNRFPVNLCVCIYIYIIDQEEGPGKNIKQEKKGNEEKESIYKIRLEQSATIRSILSLMQTRVVNQDISYALLHD